MPCRGWLLHEKVARPWRGPLPACCSFGRLEVVFSLEAVVFEESRCRCAGVVRLVASTVAVAEQEALVAARLRKSVEVVQRIEVGFLGSLVDRRGGVVVPRLRDVAHETLVIRRERRLELERVARATTIR